ncbi:MAG: hypothetical protein H7Y12_09790 [Sphingobacteriaceae bacterium]|nr:hypothetical protein [Cytophagaceae bacterium]
MKTSLYFLLATLLSSPLFAQTSAMPDSLGFPRRGFAVWTDFGLTDNASLQNLRNQLAPLGITWRGTRISTFGVSSYQRNRRSDGEGRLWRFSNGDDFSGSTRSARIRGIGLGMLVMQRVVDTRRFTVGPELGYDVLFYRLNLDAVAPGTVPIQTVLANPVAYQTVKLNGFALTLQAALTAGLKFNLFPKFYESWQLNARIGYHLPVLYTRDWKYDQTTVSGIDAYKPAHFYGNVGLVMFPRFERSRFRRY